MRRSQTRNPADQRGGSVYASLHLPKDAILFEMVEDALTRAANKAEHIFHVSRGQWQGWRTQHRAQPSLKRLLASADRAFRYAVAT